LARKKVGVRVGEKKDLARKKDGEKKKSCLAVFFTMGSQECPGHPPVKKPVSTKGVPR